MHNSKVSDMVGMVVEYARSAQCKKIDECAKKGRC